MDWLRKYWTQIIFVITFIVTITTTNIQVKANTEDIRQLERKQSNADIILQDIRVELSAINTKLELILKNSHLVVKEESK